MSNKISDIKNNEDLQYSNNKCTYKKLLSIHLQSNNPDNFKGFIKSLEDNLIDLNLIEVVVKIDDDDIQMNDLLSDLVKSSPINLKYISTPLLGNFSDLWRSMNDMLLVCEKDSYFLWNMNDEMRIPIKGWDQKLKKYVGMFPDNLFRLRTSVFRNRNYTDEWECCFAPETSAITTKKWIEICGDWNPTLGPDTFNQLVAYYFSYHDRFNKDKEIRDIVINDFNFIGEGAFLGLTKKQRMKRISETIKPWFKLISYKTLLEASRRSQKIKANIYIDKVFKGHHEAEKLYIIDRGKEIRIMHSTKKTLVRFPYKLPRLGIYTKNFTRSFQYFEYAGGGKDYRSYIKIFYKLKKYIYYIILKFKLFSIINLYRKIGITYIKIIRKKNIKKILKFLKTAKLIILKVLKKIKEIPGDTYIFIIEGIKYLFPRTWEKYQKKYLYYINKKELKDTDLQFFYKKIKYKKLIKFLNNNDLYYEDKIFIKYIKIVMICKFYNIKIENVNNNFELIESQIINIDDIVKNYDLHFSNIKKIDNSIKCIFNYNLRGFLDT